jgi:hypothetical protein
VGINVTEDIEAILEERKRKTIRQRSGRSIRQRSRSGVLRVDAAIMMPFSPANSSRQHRGMGLVRYTNAHLPLFSLSEKGCSASVERLSPFANMTGEREGECNGAKSLTIY